MNRWSCIVGLLVPFMMLSVQADNIRWNSVWEDDNWFNTNNWNAASLPGSSDGAFIDRAVTVQLYGGTVAVSELFISGYSSSGSLGALVVNDGESVTANHLKVATYSGDNGALVVSGGVVQVSGWLKISEAAGSTGHVELSGGSITVGTLNFDEDAADFGGSMNITGGTLYLDGNDSTTVWGYIADGHLTGYGTNLLSVTYDSGEDQTIVQAVTELQTKNVRWKSSWADEDWYNVNNWDLGTYPNEVDNAFIDRAVTVYLNGSDASVGQLFLGGSGGTAGGLVISGETFNVSGNLNVARYTGNVGRLTVLDGAVNVGSWLKISESAGADGHVELTGGSITASTLNFDEDAADFGGSFNITGGTLYLDGNDVSVVEGYIADGHLTGHGTNLLSVVYDAELGQTVVQAVFEANIASSDDKVLLSWNSMDSYEYSVLTNGNLATGSWVLADTVLGTGGSITWTSNVADADSLFYKIEYNK